MVKPQLNLVFLGHVDSGKSTAAGHLLFKCGGVDDIMARCVRETSCIGRMGYKEKFTYILDTLRSERERGITIETSFKPFETSHFSCTVIDVPGHRDYIKNMIHGTSQADVFGILMVSAIPGHFEKGIGTDGQTREHALLAFTLGVKYLIVCINQMDYTSVRYSEDIFQRIKSEVSLVLKKIGYKRKVLSFLPLSGWIGDNLVGNSTNMPW